MSPFWKRQVQIMSFLFHKCWSPTLDLFANSHVQVMNYTYEGDNTRSQGSDDADSRSRSMMRRRADSFEIFKLQGTHFHKKSHKNHNTSLHTSQFRRLRFYITARTHEPVYATISRVELLWSKNLNFPRKFFVVKFHRQVHASHTTHDSTLKL